MTIAPNATAKTSRSIFSTILHALASIPGPITMISARQDLDRFRSSDVALLTDMGLSREDVEKATFFDFVNQPRR